MRQTLESVVGQSIRPTTWVIVDDGSTDASASIVREFACANPWIRLVSREDRGSRAVGPGVVEAFCDGYRSVDPREYEFICKLDLDLRLPPSYFECLIDLMNRDCRLGTWSGKAYVERRNRVVCEGHGNEMSLGMAKFYRRACFEQIGGFVREVMWDGIDCHRCRMLGWKAGSSDEPGLRFMHLRPEGSSQSSVFRGRLRAGFGQYFMGTGLLYMCAIALNKSRQPPYLAGGFLMLVGWIVSMVKGLPRYEDLEFRAFLRKYQRLALIYGKSGALERMHRSSVLEGRLPTPGAL
jgi:poly-beta-1,6-N-acetyl-D-glucosamine synthase